MSSGQPSLVHLRRVDPERGMWRYYSLTLQPTLLGDVDLIRRWGRLGTAGAGAVLVETFPDEAAAQAAMERLIALKRRRGYADAPSAPAVVPVRDRREEGRPVSHPVPCPASGVLPLMSPWVTGAEPAARPG